jgi:hypothetical protein
LLVLSYCVISSAVVIVVIIVVVLVIVVAAIALLPLAADGRKNQETKPLSYWVQLDQPVPREHPTLVPVGQLVPRVLLEG